MHQIVEQGYDRLAASYDDEIGSNEVGNRMRLVFRRVLKARLPPRAFVFEVGCGTGLEAVWLAHSGCEVVATDISPRMLERVSAKAAEAGLSDRIHVRRLPASDIGALADEYGSEAFDGAYSHAGALNMEPDLARVPAQLATLLKRGAPFVCSVINRISLFELLFYPAVMKPRKAFRRLGNFIPIPISRREPLSRHVVPTRFFTPRELARIFAGHFTVEATRGMQVFLPPSNLTDVYSLLYPAFAPLEALEDRLAARPPVNQWGHHSILTFRRT